MANNDSQMVEIPELEFEVVTYNNATSYRWRNPVTGSLIAEDIGRFPMTIWDGPDENLNYLFRRLKIGSPGIPTPLHFRDDIKPGKYKEISNIFNQISTTEGKKLTRFSIVEHLKKPKEDLLKEDLLPKN